MASSTLKFGPEWLRNLSDGSGSAAPSSSSTSSSLHGSSSHGTIPVPKYKLAEFRYGREEMLGLFCPPVAVPEELKDFKAILSDRQLQPLALQVEADDEQHLFSQPVNSTAVIRLTNRGVSTPLCLREVDRGRGRGRGRAEGRGFYSRVPNEEESFPRGRHPKDGNDTDSRGRGFGNTGRSFDDMSTFSSSHAEFSRSMSTDNWRDSRKYEDSKGNWRDLNQRPTTRRWKEPWEKGFDGSRDRATDRRMSEDGCHDRPVSAYRRSTSSNFAYEEESDPLPEWSTDDSEDIGTFDSSGAFMSLRELEQQEKDKDGHSEESWQDKEDELEKNNLEFEKDRTTEELGDVDDKQCNITFELKDEGGLPLQQPLESASGGDLAIDSNIAMEAKDTNKDVVTVDDAASLVLSSNGNVLAAATEKKADNKEVVMESLGLVDVSSSNCQMEQHDAEVNFDHLELQVEHLYASIISADEENVGSVEKEKGFLPLDHEDAKKWFYRDPQGQVQGPFSAVEMAEWFSAGYFSPNLVVKQGSDDCFVPLGELIKKMGSVPFISAPLKIPPNVVNTATDLQQMQPDPLKLLLLQQQQQQKQQQQQQQQALPQQLQQQLRNPQEPFSKMSPAQQQQLLLQLILKQHLNPQMAAPTSQQQRPTKTSTINRPSPLDALNVNPFGQLSTASSLPSNNTASSFHRSMSQSAAIEASALPSSLLFGLTTTTAATASATNLPKGGAPSASALWRSSSCAPSASNPSWMPDSGASLGSWNQEPKSITAAELEEFQYQALEKAQQQQSTQALSNLRDPRLLLQELVAHAAAEKRRDVNGTGALVSIDQLRELLQQQQQKQQTDIVRLAEEQRRLLDENRRVLEMNPRLLRQDRSDDLYCKQQLENLCRLQNDSLTSSMQERDALVVRQLLSLQSAQSWAATQNRTQMTGGLPSSIHSSSLFQHKDNGSSSSPSIVQQELLNKHLKLNEMKTALNQWPIGIGGSNHWTGETGTWAAALPSKSPVQWDATTAVNNKTINSMIPFVPGGGGGGGGGGLPTQVKQEFIQKLAKSKEELMLWCENVLKSMLTCSSMDIPTFIHHLMDLTSPAEVNQFVQMYLGDTDDAKKFVKQFVEKHSRMQFIQKKALLMHLSSGSQW